MVVFCTLKEKSMDSKIGLLHQNLTAHLLGSEEVSLFLITGLLAEGHVLIQGPPGVGKTSMAKTLAGSVQSVFKRIQFTSDLLPADILGYTVYDQRNSEFVFYSGPIFSHIVLADEINRASPRVQSALLECMSERQVSVDGATRPLERPFFVVATENDMASAGTFPLPDSQLDRFLLSFQMEAPAPEVQLRILELHAAEPKRIAVQPVMSRDELLAAMKTVRNVRIDPNIMHYIVLLSETVRDCGEFTGGPSPRACIALMHAAQALAYLNGRNAVYPDEIKKIMPYVFRHRLILKGRAGMHMQRVENLLREILDATPVPMDIA